LPHRFPPCVATAHCHRALAAANGTFSGCVTNKDDAYFAARGLRDDWLGSLSGDFSLTDAVTLKTTAYYHRNEGQATVSRRTSSPRRRFRWRCVSPTTTSSARASTPA
jgi:hypothetical protein